MKGELFINGKDAFTTWGIFLDSSGMSTLLTPPPIKEPVSNSSRLKNGFSVVPGTIKLDSRDITLTINLTATSKEQFLEKYTSFCEELSTGFLTFKTKYQPSIYYRFLYRNCQQFSEYNMEAGKFLLRLTEMDPSNRKEEE